MTAAWLRSLYSELNFRFGDMSAKKKEDSHKWYEIENYGTPTGYWVCDNIKCGYSVLWAWVWYEDLDKVKPWCPFTAEENALIP